MNRKLLLVPLLLLATGAVPAEDASKDKRDARAAEEAQAKTEKGTEEASGADAGQAKADNGAKLVSGMSILGNQEAPKSLGIVPWKSSELGASLRISPMLDDSRGPVDRDVFMRALSYYEVRSETTRRDGGQPAAPAPRSKS